MMTLLSPSERKYNLLRSAFVSLCLITSFPSGAVAQHPVLQANPDNVAVPAERGSIPMLDYGGRPLVEVRINGKGAYRFILDTGATINVIDTSVATELGLPDRPTIEEFKLGKVSVR